MKAFFRELLNYNNEMNRALITVCEQSSEEHSNRTYKLLSHIINAHKVWNERIEEGQSFTGVWDVRMPEQWRDLNEENHEQSVEILEKKELDETFEYINTKGQEFENSVRDGLFHIINHSNYHRAQLATEFRETGFQPVKTDYIFWSR